MRGGQAGGGGPDGGAWGDGVGPDEPPGVLGVRLGLLEDALDALVAVDVDTVSVGEVADALVRVERVERRLAGLRAGLTGTFDRRGGFRSTGHRSTQQWLQARLNKSAGTARREARTAKRLREGLSATREALEAGDISFEQADAIAETAEKLDPHDAHEAQRRLLGEAAAGDATRVKQAGKRLVAEADRQAALRAHWRRAHRQRTFSVRDDGAGSSIISGRVRSDVGGALRGLLDRFQTVPTDADRDERTPGQRDADALEAWVHATTDGHPGGAAEGGRDGRRAAGSSGGAGRAGGVVAVAPIDTVRGRGGVPATLRWGRQPIPDEALAALVCEHGLSVLLTDLEGVPLWLGEAVRFATDDQRAALTVRDGGCRWPGCPMPPERCIAHHVDHTADSPGPTDIDRLAWFCRVHHNLIHHGGWTLVLDDTATVQVRAPDGRVLTETAATARHRHHGSDTIHAATSRSKPTDVAPADLAPTDIASEDRATYDASHGPSMRGPPARDPPPAHRRPQSRRCSARHALIPGRDLTLDAPVLERDDHCR